MTEKEKLDTIINNILIVVEHKGIALFVTDDGPESCQILEQIKKTCYNAGYDLLFNHGSSFGHCKSANAGTWVVIDPCIVPVWAA